MIYAILDFIVQPYIHSYGASFSMLMDLRNSSLENYPAIAFFFAASLTGCFAATIYAIAINFVFRFFALQREGRLRYFSGKLLFLWISIPLLAGIVWVTNNYILFSPNQEMTDYLRSEVKELYDLDAGKMTYAGCLYWRINDYGQQYLSMRDLIGAMNLSSIMMIPFATIVFFGSKSYTKVTQLMSQGESEYSKKLQMQLYKALVAQTLIPMLFLFFPVGIFFVCPLIGINIEWASFLITFFYSFYPAVDPIPIIILVDDYRNAFFTNISPKPPIFNNKCYIQQWNRINTQTTSHSYWNLISKWLWIKLDLSNERIQNNTATSILAAYVYPNSIAISLISQYLVKQKVYCRYYDCERKEIPESAWLGVVFPESVVECPRRIGAEFMSVSRTLEEEPPTPVRLIYRVYKEPIHELSVCVAPLYGNQSSWLPIVDFMEHNKLEGASYFYFYVGEISKYDERMLIDYVRTGDMEVVKMQDKYQRVFIGWHFLQIQDCHLRSKYHSRWTAFIDLDERITTFGQRMIDLLRSIQDPAIGEVQLQILSVVKDQDYPERFVNLETLKKEMIFKKYNRTIGPTWQGMKAVVRSDKIGIMSIHAAVAKYPGIKTMTLEPQKAVMRHLRSTKYRIYGSDWHEKPDENGELPVIQNTPLPQEFSEILQKTVIKRVLHVYDRVPVNCSLIPKELQKMLNHPDPCKEMWPYF